MLILLLGLGIWLGWLIGAVVWGDDLGERIAFGLAVLLLGWVPILLVYFVIFVTFGSILPHKNIYVKKGLVALQDGNNTNGAFFLGSGYISDKPTYTFYLDVGRGGSKLENAGADHIQVFQDSAKPYALVSVDCKGHWTWLVKCNNGFTNTSDDKYTIGEIHTPSGTIKQNFVLDAK